MPQLAAGAPLARLLAWLNEQRGHASIALVGHAPDLACLATALISQREGPALKIRKGGACLVSLGGEPEVGTLRWLMDANQLGKMTG